MARGAPARSECGEDGREERGDVRDNTRNGEKVPNAHAAEAASSRRGEQEEKVINGSPANSKITRKKALVPYGDEWPAAEKHLAARIYGT